MAAMSTESGKPTSRQGRYPQEFRRDAAALVIDQHRTIVDRGENASPRIVS